MRSTIQSVIDIHHSPFRNIPHICPLRPFRPILRLERNRRDIKSTIDVVIPLEPKFLARYAHFGSCLSIRILARSYPRVIPALSMSHTSICSSERLRSRGRRKSNDSFTGSHRGSNVLYRVDVEPASLPFHVTKHLGSDLPSRSAYVVDQHNLPPSGIGMQNRGNSQTIHDGKLESTFRVHGGSVVHQIQFYYCRNSIHKTCTHHHGSWKYAADCTREHLTLRKPAAACTCRTTRPLPGSRPSELVL